MMVTAAELQARNCADEANRAIGMVAGSLADAASLLQNMEGKGHKPELVDRVREAAGACEQALIVVTYAYLRAVARIA